MRQSHLLYSQKLFFRLFPPPAFLLMPSVGVDISDRAARFIELLSNRGSFRIKRFGEQVLPAGVIARGDIKDAATLKTALIALRRDYNLSYVRVALPEEKAFLFRTEVPLLSAEETKENIAFQLEEHVPISASDAIFDYTIAEPLFGKTNPGLREAVVSVFPRPVVDSYLSVFAGAGLTPLSFEMEGAALSRAVIPEGDQGTYMIADIGEMRTGIIIVSRGTVHFTTTIDIGGGAFTDEIEKRLNVGAEEALTLKQEGAFSRHGKYRELFSVLIEEINPLKEQISKHFVYWHNHPDKKDATPPPIEKVIICGSDAYLEGLAEHFSLSLRIKVEVANVWTNTFSTEHYIPPIPFGRSLAFATAVGLAMRSE